MSTKQEAYQADYNTNLLLLLSMAGAGPVDAHVRKMSEVEREKYMIMSAMELVCMTVAYNMQFDEAKAQAGIDELFKDVKRRITKLCAENRETRQ